LAGLLASGAVAAAIHQGWLVPAAVGSRDEKPPVYQCSMHPQIVTHEPGLCPICQMALQRVDDHAVAARERQPLFYRHPMRADVVSPVPAKDEMGMDYIPVYEADAGSGMGDVPGHAGFSLSTQRQQLIGVTREHVERRPLEVVIRAVGRVAYDPMLYQAIVEYREALKTHGRLAHSSWGEAQEGADAILRAAALKLRQQGLSEAQLAEIGRGGGDPLALLLPGKSVWVYAQVYEYEAPLVAHGQKIEVTVPSIPGRTFEAKVATIDPVLDPTTRTVRVRALVPTPEESLRPETFVQVKITVPLGEQLALPREAVLDTGDHQIVFVVRGEGQFEPRSVRLGREAEGYYEVLSGLSEGDEVVTSANFLIDSESRFRSALAAFKGSSTAGAHQH
jgi:hypothetical protein